MSSLSEQEVEAGRVVHLDTTVLRNLGGSQTNAQVTVSQDRAVVGPHYFLITSVDEQAGTCLAVPLFSKFAPGSELLDENKKSGYADKWRGENSYFSRWQHWIIPVSAIPAASVDEESDPTSRRSYAAAETETLSAISAWAEKNRCNYRNL